MKTLVTLGAMAAVLGLCLSASAADNNTGEFYALTEVSSGSQLNVMTDRQLTAVEGMSYRRNDCGCRGSNSWSSSHIKQGNDLAQLNLLFGGGKYLHDVGQYNGASQVNNIGALPYVR